MNITVLAGLESDNAGSYDPVVDQVASALREKGHQVSIFAVYKSVSDLVEGLTSRKPDLVAMDCMSYRPETKAAVRRVLGVPVLLAITTTGRAVREMLE